MPVRLPLGPGREGEREGVRERDGERECETGKERE